MANVLINENSLVAIGDALRRKHGETKDGIVTNYYPNIEYVIPTYYNKEQILNSNSYNLQGKQDFVYSYTISGAKDIVIELTYNLYANMIESPQNAPKIYIAIGDYGVKDFPEDAMLVAQAPCSSTYLKETKTITIENTDTISIRYVCKSHAGTYGSGIYYAEIWGLDENGEVALKAVEEPGQVRNDYLVSEMADAIDVLGEALPEEAFVITGDCNYRFANNGWNWFINKFGDKITTKDIKSANNMFKGAIYLNNLPFEFNFKDGGCDVGSMFSNCSYNLTEVQSIDFKQTSYKDCNEMFYCCYQLIKIGTIKNMYPSDISSMFSSCQRLRELPEFENLNLDRIHTYGYSACDGMFNGCYSLRSIPEDFLKQFYGIWTSYYNTIFYYAFMNCYVLDEVRGLNPQTGAITSNMFSNTFNSCYRLKDIIFATQDDGTPYSANWKNQTIDLSQYVGYSNTNYGSYIPDRAYNSGIAEDKLVSDDASYQALKDDPDWFSNNINYARYNHDSAVNTINSLPIITATGTNTIKFKGAAGASTDGGAINTLTEEEIAVAAAKGWTVSLVQKEA